MRSFTVIFCVFMMTIIASATEAPELPRLFLGDPDTGPVLRTIGVGDGEDLQSKINSALPGDKLSLLAGSAFTGNFYFRNMPEGGFITLTTSREAELPAGRIGPEHTSLLAKLQTPNTGPVLDFYPTYGPYTKARSVVLRGLELTFTGQTVYDLVKIGGGGSWQTTAVQAPTDIVIDRCYLHGFPSATLRRAIALQGVRVWILNSYISEVHEVGVDSQAICGWNGPGPYRIVNNYLQAAGENVMFGGADPRIPGLVPADIEFRLNHCFKPLAWNPRDPSYVGPHWAVKNLFELKNARRVLVDSNLFENNWLDAQSGPSILFTPRNQSGTAPWSTVEDVTFSNNVIRNVAAGVAILGTDYNFPSGITSRLRIVANKFIGLGSDVLGGNGRLLQILDGGRDIDFSHNYGESTHSFLLFDGPPTEHLNFTSNVVYAGLYGIIGSGTGSGTATLNQYAPGYTLEKNAIVGSINLALYPANNFATQ